MVGDRLDHARRAGEAGARADVDLHRAGADEAVDQVLGQARGRPRPPTAAPARRRFEAGSRRPRRGRSGGWRARSPPNAGPKSPPCRPAQIADADPRGAGMGVCVGAHHAQRGAHEVVGSPARQPVGRAPADRVPGEEVGARGGQPDAAHQPAGVGEPDRLRAAPVDRGPRAMVELRSSIERNLAIAPMRSVAPWDPRRPPRLPIPAAPSRAAGRATTAQRRGLWRSRGPGASRGGAWTLDTSAGGDQVPIAACRAGSCRYPAVSRPPGYRSRRGLSEPRAPATSRCAC